MVTQISVDQIFEVDEKHFSFTIRAYLNVNVKLYNIFSVNLMSSFIRIHNNKNLDILLT